jgi:hypothetical protein
MKESIKTSQPSILNPEAGTQHPQFRPVATKQTFENFDHSHPWRHLQLIFGSVRMPV